MLGPEAEEPLVRLAAALTARPAELVAAVRIARGHGRGQEHEQLRALTVQTFLRDRSPLPAVEPVDGLPPELTETADRVAALPSLDRAVLVLRYVEQLTHAEIAGILDRSPATVARTLDRALAALEVDPYDLVAVLHVLSQQPVDPSDVRRAEITLAARRRRRTRRRWLTTVAALAVLVALVLPGVLRGSTPTPDFGRGYRVWMFSFTLEPPESWQIESRAVTADVETTELRRSGSAPGRCHIMVGQLPEPAQPPGRTRAVRIGGHPARLSSGADQAVLSWSPSDHATASVSCSGAGDTAALVTGLARRMVFTGQPIALPYRLGAVPSHFHVDQVTVRPQQGLTVVELWPDEVSGGTSVPISVVQSTGSGNGFEVPGLELAGADATTSCRLLEAISVCAGVAAPGALDAPREQARTTLRLRLVTDAVELAPSGSDRFTWFDARDALPYD